MNKAMIALLLVDLTACSINSAAPEKEAAITQPGLTYVVGFTMRQDKPQLERILEVIVRMVFEVMEQGDEILVVDTATM